MGERGKNGTKSRRLAIGAEDRIQAVILVARTSGDLSCAGQVHKQEDPEQWRGHQRSR